jgi:hypothetical protein
VTVSLSMRTVPLVLVFCFSFITNRVSDLYALNLDRKDKTFLNNFYEKLNFIFICSLFNYTVSSSYCTALNNRMISEL